LAQPATKGALEAARRSSEAAEKAQEQTVADARAAAEPLDPTVLTIEAAAAAARGAAEQLDRTVLTIEQQAGDDGRLFGSVTNQDIADAIQEARGIRGDRPKIPLAPH